MDTPRRGGTGGDADRSPGGEPGVIKGDHMSSVRRALVVLAAAAAILGSGGGVSAATGPTAPAPIGSARCDTRWGTGAKGTLPVELGNQ